MRGQQLASRIVTQPFHEAQWALFQLLQRLLRSSWTPRTRHTTYFAADLQSAEAIGSVEGQVPNLDSKKKEEQLSSQLNAQSTKSHCFSVGPSSKAPSLPEGRTLLHAAPTSPHTAGPSSASFLANPSPGLGYEKELPRRIPSPKAVAQLLRRRLEAPVEPRYTRILKAEAQELLEMLGRICGGSQP